MRLVRSTEQAVVLYRNSSLDTFLPRKHADLQLRVLNMTAVADYHPPVAHKTQRLAKVLPGEMMLCTLAAALSEHYLNSLESIQKFKFICAGLKSLSFKSHSLSAVLETPLGVCVTQFMT